MQETKKIAVAILNHNISLNKILQLTFPSEEFDLMTFAGTDELQDALRGAFRVSLILFNRSVLGGKEHDFCRCMREHKGYEDIPILALQDAFFLEDGRSREGLPWDGLFIFPFDPEDLVEEVRRLVGAAGMSLPLPEEPPGAINKTAQNWPDLDTHITRLADRLWSAREKNLQSEIFAQVKKEITLWMDSGNKPESGDS